tara:strand:+ start:762 stop:1298 length:537 start_codon:yes stop_codon:yes gene_type:complete
MDRNKILAITAIPWFTLASSTFARESEGKIGWQDLDANRDGIISFLEFQESEHFELGPIDSNEDGLLSLDEFLQPSQIKSGSKNPSRDSIEKKKSLASEKFKKMDTNFNGFIDIAELQDAKFDAADKNRDGVLSRKELRPKRQFRGAKRKNSQRREARGRGRKNQRIPNRNWRHSQRD